jgi:hypothetical protein
MKYPRHQLNNFPLFTALTAQEENGQLLLSGKLKSTYYKSQKWVRDKSFGYLFKDEQWVHGRWRKHHGKEWSFKTITGRDGSPAEFILPSDFRVINNYWGERAVLVFDKTIKWQSKNYNQNDSHDHCSICWEAIYGEMDYMEGQSQQEKNIPLCLECYNRYVIKDNFDWGCTR